MVNLATRLSAVTPPRPDSDLASRRAFMARVGSLLFLCGGLLGLVSLAAPNSLVNHEWLYWAMSFGALGIALLLWKGSHRLPGWVFQAALMFGTLMISVSIHFTEEIRTDNEILYLWTALYAFYFFSRVAAALQLAFVGLCYGLALAAEGGSAAGGQVTRWLVTMSALAVVGVMIRLLNKRVGELIKRLADAARTDPLTGVLNRRGFEELMGAELERSRRSGRPLSLLAGDLDHFKLVNDRFGHGRGDLVLRRVADLLTAAKRRIDTAARIGGEEFAVLLPETDAHGAYVLAERLRDAVAAEYEERPEGVTISFGVATFPLHRDDSESLMAAADQALYAAKKLGRNRTVIYSPQVDDILEGTAATAPDPEIHLATLITLAEALDIRDSGTAKHSQTVGRLAASMAKEMGFEADHVERVRVAGVLHDIGKIAVSDTILRKPGRLTPEEWAEIQRHPETGARLLGHASDDIRRWVLCHHERPDGGGYPRGLRGDEVPVEARILAVADAYEAMTADRPYSAPKADHLANQELRRYAGSQFDSDIVELFLAAQASSETHRP